MISPTPIDSPTPTAFRALAVGRIALGVASLFAPRSSARLLGIADRPDVRYMTRIYGSRAIAMGVSYLTSSRAAQARWERFGLAIDVSDTAAGTVHLVRRDFPLPLTLGFLALTGGYAAVGALSLQR